MAITLPDLPYPKDALEPVISSKTLEFHHGKHHNAYVVNTNKLIEGTEMAGAELEAIIKKTAGDTAKAGLFNNAAQVWNHSFFWKSMAPGGGGAPAGELLDKINADFGGFDKFVEEFKAAGATQFGSGWAWLVLDGGTLKIVKAGNAGNPLRDGQTPILTIDVWEHAYYVDYRNARPKYIEVFMNNLVNWDFAAANYESATA